MKVNASNETADHQRNADPLRLAHAEGHACIETQALNGKATCTVQDHEFTKQEGAFVSPLPEKQAYRETPERLILLCGMNGNDRRGQTLWKGHSPGQF
jgi:hypothetical protein